ncbi:hypothetical protein B0H13DRAFT_2563225 [Mycena leptocephala]|nr:hypothetical protein B0H13DRAFT_2563225 [Mycena leptocephala]
MTGFHLSLWFYLPYPHSFAHPPRRPNTREKEPPSGGTTEERQQSMLILPVLELCTTPNAALWVCHREEWVSVFTLWNGARNMPCPELGRQGGCVDMSSVDIAHAQQSENAQLEGTHKITATAISDSLCLAAMGQSESRQRPPEYQQPQRQQQNEQQKLQEKPRRRLRNSIRALIPKRRHITSVAPAPTTNERRPSRWSRAFCRPSPSPSPSPSRADAQVDGDEEKVPYRDAEEKGDPDTHSDMEDVSILGPLDDLDDNAPTPMPQAHVPHLPVPPPGAQVPPPQAQVLQVDEAEVPDGDAEEGEDAGAGADSGVEAMRVLGPHDDLDDEAPTPVAHASETQLLVPQPQAQPPHVDEEEAPDSVAEDGGDAGTGSGVEGVHFRAPLDDSDEETPTPMPHAPEAQLAVPQPQAQVPQADDEEAPDGDSEEGGDADTDSGVNDVHFRAPLDESGDQETQLPVAQPQARVDDEEAPDGDAEEGGDADVDSGVEDARVGAPLDNLDEVPQVDEEDVPDGDTEEGGDTDADADSGAEDVHFRARLDHSDEETPTPIPHAPETQLAVPQPQAQVPQVGHGQGVVHTTDVPSPPTPPVASGTSGASNTLITAPPAPVLAISSSSIDRRLDVPRSLPAVEAQAATASLIAGSSNASFARPAAAFASPRSISPLNPSPASSAYTPVHLPLSPPPYEENVRQAAPAPAWQAPSRMRQPFSPAPPPRASSFGGGSQAGRSRDEDICYNILKSHMQCRLPGHWASACPNRGGSQAGRSRGSRALDECSLLAPTTQALRKEGRSLLFAGHAIRGVTTAQTVPEGGAGARAADPLGTKANTKNSHSKISR